MLSWHDSRLKITTLLPKTLVRSLIKFWSPPEGGNFFEKRRRLLQGQPAHSIVSHPFFTLSTTKEHRPHPFPLLLHFTFHIRAEVYVVPLWWMKRSRGRESIVPSLPSFPSHSLQMACDGTGWIYCISNSSFFPLRWHICISSLMCPRCLI